MNAEQFPECWQTALADDLRQPWCRTLQEFVQAERRQHEVFPPADDVLTAFRLTPLNSVRAVILGQDPYHDTGQAHGLSFSVRPGVRLPPSLRNIYKELQSDLGISPASHGCLIRWAEQGVLLLNTVLTVRAHQPNSHQNQGWEQLTSRVIEVVNQQPAVAFVLWGRSAQQKAGLLDSTRHLVIQSAHPSPLSARNGFFGSRPFSQINQFMTDNGMPEIDWAVE